MNGQPASVKDVALSAGVSVGTVSNVLNLPDKVRVQTRERVLRAIAELGFVRNEPARQLRMGSSRVLAYLVLDATNPFFTDVSAGVEQVAREEGLAVFLCNSDNDPQHEARYLELLMEQRVRGVLITPVDRGSTALDIARLRGVPLVLVDGAGDTSVCSVSVDDVAGGALAGHHLVEAGHQRIGFVGGPFSLRQVNDRHAGLESAVLSAGQGQAITVHATSALNVAEGRRAGERLMGLPHARRPTAVLCANDLLALGLLQEMTTRGMSVPGNLSIVGYDDIEFAGAAAVPLTSVRRPRQALGREAAQLVLDEATNPAHEHRQVVFEPELVVRASSGPPNPLRSTT